MSGEKAVKEALKGGKAVIGKKAVIRGMKAGTLHAVLYSSNCPAGTLRDIGHYGKLGGVSVQPFGGDSARLGQMCGKPFSVTVLGIKK